MGMAAVTTVVCRKLSQPTVLGYLLAGLIVGPYVPIPLFADAERVATLSELGVILVMFGIGLEFSLRRLARVVARTGIVAMLQIGTMMWLGYLGGRLLGWSRLEAVFVGSALCISSTMIVAREFADRTGRERLAELVFSVLVLQDVAAVVLIAVLTFLSSGAASTVDLPAGEVTAVVLRLVLFLLALVAVGFLLVPRAVRLVARLRSAETLLVACIGLCFGMAELAHLAGFSVALGAFLAGSLAAESGSEKEIEHLVRPVRDMFAAMFFVTVGMAVDPASLLQAPGAIALLVSIVVVGQVVSVTLGSVLAGYRIHTAVLAGMSLAQVGEFSFIIAGIGTAAGVVRPSLYPVIVAVSAVTCFLSPWLARASQPLANLVDRSLPPALQTFVSLYGTWLENLRASDHRHTLGHIVRRAMLWLVVDALLMAATVIGAALLEPRAVAWFERSMGIAHGVTRLAVVVGALALASPFMLGMVRMSRHLGTVLARAALPYVSEGQTDFAATPRRVYLMTVQFGVLLCGLLPVAAVTQPFLPAWAGAGLLALAIGSLGLAFWRGAVELAGHAEAGAEVVAAVLSRHAAESVPGANDASPRTTAAVLKEAAERGHPDSPPVDLRDVERMLPGLGTLLELRLPDDSVAVGRSLRDLNLRGRTGATVIAISRGETHVVSPPGGDALEAGDLICLMGTQLALGAAREELTQRRPPEPTVPGPGADGATSDVSERSAAP